MATVTGTRRLLDISGNNISTAVSLEAEGTLIDVNGAAGTSGQVLSSIGSGVDWVDASSVIGGPYLPLSAGSSYPLTGDLYVGTSTAATDRFIRAYYSDSSYTEVRGYGIITNRNGSYYRPANDKTQVLSIGNDGNTWNYIGQNANYHTFGKDTSEWMRIDTSGNVGIGTTSPSATLDINGDIVISDSGDRVFTTNSQNGAFSLGDVDALADEAVVQGDGSFIFLKNAGNTTLTTTANNRVGIGTNGPGSKLDILGATNTSNSSLLRVRTTDFPNAPEKIVGFYVNTSTERGFISVNQYQTAYSTSSDYRLKENIVPIPNSIERLKELKPCRFNFIQGDPNYVVDGFIAHEAAEVIPEAVTGEKDAVDENNNPLHQGIDQSKVVPLLTAALQEAISKIEQLETRIQTLENN